MYFLQIINNNPDSRRILTELFHDYVSLVRRTEIVKGLDFKKSPDDIFCRTPLS